MRVLFTTFAAKSHMHAQVSLAWALRAAGHDVRIASHPDLAEEITKTGLTAVGVGEELHLDEQMQETQENIGQDVDQLESQAQVGLDMSETRPERLTWDYTLGVFTAMTSVVFQNCCSDRMVDELVEHCRSWKPDLVLWDTMTFAGAIAALATGTAHGRVLFGMDLAGNMRRTFLEQLAARPPEQRDDPLREWLTWSLERHGASFEEAAVTGDFTVCPMPQSMRLPVDLDYVPMRYVPYNGQSTVPRWLQEPPKRGRRVCLTLGVAHREVLGADRASIGDLLEAVAGLDDVEVVATLDENQLKDLDTVPDNVRAVDFVPLDALLPTCDAVIHHGGSGSFGTAMIHGVPQLIVVDGVWDTINKARHLDATGTGLYVPGKLSAKGLRELLVRLLEEPEFKRNAMALRREALAAPAPAQVVPTLERLAVEHRRR
ncbi:activator-dependent family glycosyltransferase [Streptomyces sp. NPDC056362]|uniref:activator-dependent family glycosyltransferase n=1 Tax=unclassified Streptomyces TaxID=2593676 RepID=UPI002E77BCE1|nr:activator-dependent family glycosyltransferase [Streptomyces sp. SP18ES09]MEE1813653.1 activator-dependent family glycosyltransferase [Streptomyces sp. SP18ES09]